MLRLLTTRTVPPASRSAPPVAVPAPSSGKAASSPRSSDEWGGKDDMMDLLPDNDAPPAKPRECARAGDSVTSVQALVCACTWIGCAVACVMKK